MQEQNEAFSERVARSDHEIDQQATYRAMWARSLPWACVVIDSEGGPSLLSTRSHRIVVAETHGAISAFLGETLQEGRQEVRYTAPLTPETVIHLNDWIGAKTEEKGRG